MNVTEHYNRLICENNDPCRDEPFMQEYMNKWDGPLFIDLMELDRFKNVLEVGVGTGRLAVKVAPLCNQFTGVDISPKTIERAYENLADLKNVELVCCDFMAYESNNMFDVIYSSLTMMHFKDKRQFVNKVAVLLKEGGRFCLSIDKNQRDCIDMGKWKLTVYPDNPENVVSLVKETTMRVVGGFETEFAHIIVCSK